MKPNLSLFTRPLFLLGLILLLTNDFYLKSAFPSMLTGKLSDFAGLFIFPYFFSVFFKDQAKYIYLITGIFFFYWKLEIAQPFITFIASITHLPLYRTVDVTDWIALLILPFSYNYFRKEWRITAKANPVFTTVIVLISCFSFVATSRAEESTPLYELNLNSGKEFIVPYSKEEIIKKYPYLGYDESNESNDFFTIKGTAFMLEVVIELKEYDKNNAIIILKKINHFSLDAVSFTENDQKDINRLLKFTVEDFEKIYEEHLIDEYGSVKSL